MGRLARASLAAIGLLTVAADRHDSAPHSGMSGRVGASPPSQGECQSVSSAAADPPPVLASAARQRKIESPTILDTTMAM
jgi:hypothetical protein